jgi:RNA polymerase sigma-70 factor (ECF subfamily)
MDIVSALRTPRTLAREPGLNEETYVHLYQHELGRILNYVRYRLGSTDAEDVTADIFARAWARRWDYDANRGQPEDWLWAIARNAVKDLLRQRRPAQYPVPTDLATADDPSAAVVQEEDWRAIQGALANLPPLDQEIIALRFGAHQTNRAIAAQLGLSEANVAQRLRRALRRMRTCLQGGAAR